MTYVGFCGGKYEKNVALLALLLPQMHKGRDLSPQAMEGVLSQSSYKRGGKSPPLYEWGSDY